MKELQGLSTK